MPAPTANLPIVGNIVTAEGRNTALNAALADVHDNIEAHKDSTANPHGVTKAQVGLGAVDDVPATALRDRATHTGTQAISTVTGLQAALDAGVTGVTFDSDPFFAILYPTSGAAWGYAEPSFASWGGFAFDTRDGAVLRTLDEGFAISSDNESFSFEFGDEIGDLIYSANGRFYAGGWVLKSDADYVITTWAEDYEFRFSPGPEGFGLSDSYGTWFEAGRDFFAAAGVVFRSTLTGITIESLDGRDVVNLAELGIESVPIESPVGIPQTALDALNAIDVAHPVEADLPPMFSTNTALFGPGIRESHLAASLAVTGKRTWAIFYAANAYPADMVPGGYTVLMYCDDLVANVWHEVLYTHHPGFPDVGFMRDPQVFTLPDGRLICMVYSHGTSGLRRCTYAFLIANPEATAGAFDIGPAQFLGFGVCGQVLMAGGEIRFPLDDWRRNATEIAYGGNKKYCRLTFTGRSGVVVEEISAVTPDDDTGLQTFDETTYVAISGDRTRAWWRSTAGIRTCLSSPGDAAWGDTEEWDAFVTPSSRAVFARSPSGRIAAGFNNATNRTNLTLALSEDDGETWPHLVRLETRNLDGAQFPSYPLMTFDERGNILVVAEFGRGGANPLGKQIILYRIAESVVIAGGASEADVQKLIIAT